MKKLFLIICLLHLGVLAGFGQNVYDSKIVKTNDSIFVKPLEKLSEIIMKANSLQPDSPKSNNLNAGLLVTNPTLNTFFKNKLSTFFTGKEDVSFFRTYAFLNTAEGVITIGQNLTNTNDTNPEKRLSQIFSYGLKANIENNYAEIFSSKQLSNSLGISLKYTFVTRGTLFYTDDHVEEMKNNRAVIYSDIKRNLIKEARQLHKDMETHAKDRSDLNINNKFSVEERTGNKKYLQSKFTKEFYKQEYEQLVDNELYDKYKQNWYTLSVYLPATSTQNLVSKTLLAKVDTFNFRPWDITATYNHAYGSHKTSNLIQVSLGIFRSNAIASGDVAEKSYNSLTFLGPVVIKQDTIFKSGSVVNVIEKTKKVFVGDYDSFWGGYLKGRAIFFPNFLDREYAKYGFDFFVDYTKMGMKEKLDFGVGIPVTAKGKDKDSNVNFEVIFRIDDVKNASTKFEDKLRVGISLGLPIEKLKF